MKDKNKTEPKKPIKNMNKGGKRGKEDTLHCSPSTANVLLTEPKKLEWEKEFDELEVEYIGIGGRKFREPLSISEYDEKVIKQFISSKIKESYELGNAQGQLDECKELLQKSKDLMINLKI